MTTYGLSPEGASTAAHHPTRLSESSLASLNRWFPMAGESFLALLHSNPFNR